MSKKTKLPRPIEVPLDETATLRAAKTVLMDAIQAAHAILVYGRRTNTELVSSFSAECVLDGALRAINHDLPPAL